MCTKESVSQVLLALFMTASLRASLASQDVREDFFREGAVRVLILSGRNNHDWRQTTPFLRRILERAQRFDVRVSEEPAGLTSASLSVYHAVVLDYMGPRWGESTEKALEEFVAAGRGLVLVHGASYAFTGLEVLADNHRRTGIREPPWPGYRKMAGGIWSGENPTTGHGDRHAFTVKFVDRDHPVSKGLGESFIATDELYHDLLMSSEAHVLATAFSDPATRGTGEDEPVLWTVAYGSGRLFHTTLGHDPVAMAEPGFVATFARGCEWAATGLVTLPASFDLNGPADPLVRALIVTGGHDYDSEFYTLFDRDWLTWRHVPSNRQALQGDIRDQYDVLFLYDLSQELGEQARRNLRSFVESGKGLIVMHHALADYNAWDWWWRDVVGGRFVLGDGEGASSARQGVELFVQLVGEHPIARGLGAMHFRDETYKNMWISPDVAVIMRVQDESSDGPVVWISPYEKSRVVCIQLGHDRNAFLNPGFQKLVERAILWSSNRLAATW